MHELWFKFKTKNLNFQIFKDDQNAIKHAFGQENQNCIKKLARNFNSKMQYKKNIS